MNTPSSSLPASERAWQWWQAAWALFLRSPREFFSLGLLYLAFNVLMFIFALKNWRLPALLLSSFAHPFVIAWLARYIRVIHQPEERIRPPSALSAEQKASWLWQVLWRLRDQLPGLWRFFWHLNSDCRLSAEQVRVLLRIGMIGFGLFFLGTALEAWLLQMGGALWALLFALLLLLAWGMAFWCAPYLVVWGHHAALKSLFFSFLTAWFNWRPILCVLFLLVSTVIGPLFFLSIFPGWFFLTILCVCWLPVVVMVYFCLIYQMALDFFPFPTPVSDYA